MSVPTSERLRSLYDTATFEEFDPADIARLDSAEDRQLAAELSAAARMVRAADDAPTPSFTGDEARPRILTLLHSCLPWLPGGYSGRAHGLMQHLSRSDVASLPLTRAGFLGDMTKGLNADDHPNDVVDDVVYQHVEAPRRRAGGEYQYMEACIDVYERVMRTFRPTAVHLRSSYPSALPGLIAAHRVGVPCVYEVSGLWELVFEGRGQVEQARRARALEAAVMRNAHAVVTLTGAMRRLIEQQYAPEQTVRLAPNAVDVDVFAPPRRTSEAVPVVGYVGSLLDYEGIDLLIRAIATLHGEGRPVRGLIVGGGPELSHLQRLVTELSMEGIVELTGPIDATAVPQYYERIDVCPLPRLSTPATEAVSPLKPFEAMAMALPLVVSDVAALSEIVAESGAGLTFRAGDAADLAAKLAEVLSMPDRGAALGARGRAFVEQNHTWEVVGASLHDALTGVAREG